MYILSDYVKCCQDFKRSLGNKDYFRMDIRVSFSEEVLFEQKSEAM